MVKLGVERLAVLVTSERFLTIDRIDTRDIVTSECWFSGLHRMEVVREQFVCYLQCFVSSEVSVVVF